MPILRDDIMNLAGNSYRYNSTAQEQETDLYRRAYTSQFKLNSTIGAAVDSWGPPSANTTDVTFYFHPQDNVHPILGSCTPLPTDFQNIIRASFIEKSQHSNMRFSEVPSPPAHITLEMCTDPGTSSMNEGIAGASNTPVTQPINTTVSTNQLPSITNNAVMNMLYTSGFDHLSSNYDYFRMMDAAHEARHAIGLLHPHPNEIVHYVHNFTVTYNASNPINPYSVDVTRNIPLNQTAPLYTKDVSIMSYYTGDYVKGTRNYDSVISFVSDFKDPPYNAHDGIMDILMSQALYGKNMNSRAGDDTYSIRSTGTPTTTAIWDAGGRNMYDASGAYPWEFDHTYINLNLDTHQPSKVGAAITYTAFDGPDDVRCGEFGNTIHGSVNRANIFYCDNAKGNQNIFPAGYDNTLVLNPDASFSSTVNYLTYGLQTAPSHDTVLGFSVARKDTILVPENIQWEDIITTSKAYNITLSDGTRVNVNGTNLAFANTNQSVMLDKVTPAQITPCVVQGSGNLSPEANGCSRNLYDVSLSTIYAINDQLADPSMQAIGGVVTAAVTLAAKRALKEWWAKSADDKTPPAVATPLYSAAKFGANVSADALNLLLRTNYPIGSFTHDTTYAFLSSLIDYYSSPTDALTDSRKNALPIIKKIEDIHAFMLKEHSDKAAEIHKMLVDGQHEYQQEKESLLDPRYNPIEHLRKISATMGNTGLTALSYFFFASMDGSKLYPFYAVHDAILSVTAKDQPTSSWGSWFKKAGIDVVQGIINRTQVIRHIPTLVSELTTWHAQPPVIPPAPPAPPGQSNVELTEIRIDPQAKQTISLADPRLPASPHIHPGRSQDDSDAASHSHRQRLQRSRSVPSIHGIA